MSNLKKKKYLGLLVIVALVTTIICLVSFGKVDKYSGLVKVNNTSVKSKILSSVGNAVLNSSDKE